MEFRKDSPLIDLVIMLIGLILLLVVVVISILNAPTFSLIPAIQSLLEAAGTSLIAAGLVSFLLRQFYAERQRNEIQVVATKRLTAEGKYTQKKYDAREKVDILGIALVGGLKEIANDLEQKLLKHVLQESVQVRLMFLSPLAPYVQNRAKEEGRSFEDLEKDLKQSVIHCSSIFARLDRLYRQIAPQRPYAGRFEIRVIDMCPHCTIFQADDELFWGIYTSAERGDHCAVLQVPRQQEKVYNQLTQHFDALWRLNSDVEKNCLLSYFDPQGPLLNERLVERILGSDWKSYLAQEIGR